METPSTSQPTAHKQSTPSSSSKLPIEYSKENLSSDFHLDGIFFSFFLDLLSRNTQFLTTDFNISFCFFSAIYLATSSMNIFFSKNNECFMGTSNGTFRAPQFPLLNNEQFPDRCTKKTYPIHAVEHNWVFDREEQRRSGDEATSSVFRCTSCSVPHERTE